MTQLRTKLLVWSLVVGMTLTLTNTTYQITFNPGADQIHLSIRSDTYTQLDILEVGIEQTSLSFQRHPLPSGSYILQAEAYIWSGCPDRCFLLNIDSSPTVIIHIPEETK